MEVITKDEVRRDKEAQADRIGRYHIMICNMRRKNRHDGH